MKRRGTISLMLFVFVVGSVSAYSCGDGGSGNGLKDAELRLLETVSDNFNLCDPSSSYSITVEMDDFNNGEDLDNLTVFITYKHNLGDDTYLTSEKKQYLSINADSFLPGPNDLPVVEFTVTFFNLSKQLCNFLYVA